ncbi:lantibiotic dehydratase [Streptomyces luteolus]|uniref:Lantibiotic dehydratase n=1 Tax=Streptomyces luteolus TaxID=3043615 RepID=A0ABT6T216_9ACTN|nr:lantibiotic dehydratase [Streptomyces sp. B-S-A12]MDI3421908.1 lantibiotic dehydratase [Streptomyces sp. B-S-A12]
MYRHVDAALIRAAAWQPDQAVMWPDLTSNPVDVASHRGWLQQIWQHTEFAAAVSAASPDLAARVQQVCAGQPHSQKALQRTVLGVLRYLLRARSRATPFGLFAGVAPARIGVTPVLRVGTGQHVARRADAAQARALIDRFEQHPVLRPHLLLVTSSLAVERDGHVVVEHRPSNQQAAGHEHVQVRVTAPVREALAGARTPILWTDLAAKLATSFPTAPPAAIEKLLGGLVKQSVLVTSLRAPMTSTDPLSALNHCARHLPPADAATIHEAPRSALDLHLDWELTVPEQVAREAAAAARALIRLAPRSALSGWAEWHGRFLERYGPRAVVPVLDAIDTLGYPPGFLGAATAPAPAPLPDRDGRLIKLAHTAALQRQLEVVLDDAVVEELATVDASHPVQPNTELTARIGAESVSTLQHGDFTLHVTGVSRSAGSTTGRFLNMLPTADQQRMSTVYATLPGIHQGALVAQISATPLSRRAENVARAPQVTDAVITLGDYQDPDTDVVPVTDLAITADATQLHLVSLSRECPVHTLLLSAVDLGHHSHPLTRFLAEAPAALAVPCTGFMWGTAASNLPFLPALRYRRTVLSPARWLLTRNDLPEPSVPWPQWDQALTCWRHEVALPEHVYLSEADQTLALDLAEPSHRALLRAHVERDDRVTLRTAPHPEDLGWSGGRAHEVVIPLVSNQDVAPVRMVSPAVARRHSRPPGSDGQLYVQLHGHRDRQDAILLRHLPDLLGELGDPDWWFIRYHEPGDHLRLRLVCPPATVGAAFERVAEWTQHLRHHGLITHAGVETYHPETARFGGSTAIGAAERYFATDSAAATAQLAAQASKDAPDARAMTAASMVDIAIGLLGDRAEAMRWLVEHTRTSPNAPPRAVYRQAIDLVTTPGTGLDQQIAADWSARRAALADYRQALASSVLDPGDVLPDLLHLHHVRMRGPGLPEEGTHLHLARAAALSWSARGRRRA